MRLYSYILLFSLLCTCSVALEGVEQKPLWERHGGINGRGWTRVNSYQNEWQGGINYNGNRYDSQYAVGDTDRYLDGGSGLSSNPAGKPWPYYGNESELSSNPWP